MKVCRIDVSEPLPSYFSLGRQGEHLATQVRFNIAAWVAQYGDGSAHLIAGRSGDAVPYPAVVTREGGDVVWNVTSADTAAAGHGYAELQYRAGGRIVKSEVFSTYVEAVLEPAGARPPEPYQSWVDNVLEAGTAAQAAAEQAQAAHTAIEDMTVSAETLPAGSGATVEKTVVEGVVNLGFGIPSGGAGLPSGGTAGQFLRKRSAADGDAVWVDLPAYDGSYEVTPLPLSDTVMGTARRYLDRDVVVKAIPYQEVSNESGGLTATIGG